MIKTAIIPLLVLMLFSLGATSFGEYDAQLSSLLAVVFAYGQFILVFNDNSIDSKSISVADRVNFMGFLITFIQYAIIITLSYFDIQPDNINGHGEVCSIN